jgi:adenylate cyclase
LRPRARIS